MYSQNYSFVNDLQDNSPIMDSYYNQDFINQSSFMLYKDCLSLSETSVSSIDIHTPDIHPVTDLMVTQTSANDSFIHHNLLPQQKMMMWPFVQPILENDNTLSNEWEMIPNYNIDCNISQIESSEDENTTIIPEDLSKEELIQRVIELEKEKKQLDNTIQYCYWNNCNTIHKSLEQLISHIKESHIGSGKPAYYCEWLDCSRSGKPFLKRHKMYNHMRTHTGEKPFECTTKGCDKRFSRLDSLNTHIKTHSNIRPFTCPNEHCTKAYFHLRSLRKHLKSHESRTKLFNNDIYPYEIPFEASNYYRSSKSLVQENIPIVSVQPHPYYFTP